MARPVPRRRAERDAPDADEYAAPARRGRAAEPEEDAPTERRPRGRARETAAADDEPEAPRGRGRGALPARGSRRAPEPEPEPTVALPASLRELRALSDEEFDDLVEELGLPRDADEDEVWDAVQVHATPEPSPRRRGRAATEDEAPAPRRGRAAARDEDEDEDEGSTRTARRGFSGFKKTRAATTSFDDFKLTEDEILGKFLPTVADADHVKEYAADGQKIKVGDLIAAEPFATYGEHSLFNELSEGQRVWTCLAPDEDCPLCDTGHKARAVALWNVVVIPESGAPQLKVLKAGPKLQGVLEKKHALKTGPLEREYYSLSQSASGKKDAPVEYFVELVRTRDLSDPDGWDVEPFTDAEIDEWLDKAHDASFVKFPTAKTLRDIAAKIRNSD